MLPGKMILIDSLVLHCYWKRSNTGDKEDELLCSLLLGKIILIVSEKNLMKKNSYSSEQKTKTNCK